MEVLDVTSWGMSAADVAGTRRDPVGATSHRASARRHTIWQALGRVLAAAAIASAISNPEVHAMILSDRLERETYGR